MSWAVVALICMAAASPIGLKRFHHTRPAGAAPGFSGKTVDGFSYDFDPGSSERTLVVFYASWCAPCVQETPSLINLASRYKNWKLVLVSGDSAKADLLNFIKIFPGLRRDNVVLLWDFDGTIAGRYGVHAFPESFVIDRQGVIQSKLIGASDWGRL